MKSYSENMEDKIMSNIMARRLKELRTEYKYIDADGKQRHLSHVVLSQRLEELGTGVSVSALKNYETLVDDNERKSKAYSNIGMSANTLCALAKFYNVSADYLLGLSDCPSVSVDIQIAQKTLGLSIRALDNLVYIYNRKNMNDDIYSSYMAILNSLFGKKGTIIKLLREIKYAKDEIARIRDEILPKIKMIDITDLQVYQKSLRHIQRDVSELVEYSLGSITGRSTLQTMITNRIKELEEIDFDTEEADDGETE